MKKTIATLSLLALAACAATQENVGPPTAFRLTSPGMPDNSMLPPKAAGNFAKNANCTGQNVSPALQWTNTPEKTRSFAIIWDDQAGRAGLGVSHAVIYGIPANVTSFPEGALGGAPSGGQFVAGARVRLLADQQLSTSPLPFITVNDSGGCRFCHGVLRCTREASQEFVCVTDLGVRNASRGVPPQWQRCRSFSSASSHRKRAWRRRDQDP